MLQRVDDWFAYFAISPADAQTGRDLADVAARASAGMLVLQDFHALAAALLHFRPRNIFEVGTHFGATSNFILDLLPQAQLTSIAYYPEDDVDAGIFYRPSEIALDQIGALVTKENRSRFTQLLGSSGQITARDFLARWGAMDFVFIDSEPGAAALAANTAVARAVVAPQGAIAWHDANPKRKYMASRVFLENDLGVSALATADSYIGGVALWSPQLETRLKAGE